MAQIFDIAPRPGRGPRLSAAQRSALAKQVARLFEHWQLDHSTACELLGLSPDTRSTLYRYAQGAPLANRRDLIDRAGNLMAVHKSLRLLFPHNRDLVYRWPTARNRAFGGRRPVDLILEHGLPGLIALRSYLDHLRGINVVVVTAT